MKRRGEGGEKRRKREGSPDTNKTTKDQTRGPRKNGGKRCARQDVRHV